MMTRRLRLFTISACAVASFGCRTSIDGAWTGEADCADTGSHALDVLFNEQEDGDLDGSFFIENSNFFGADLTLKANIDGGEFDADDNDYNFDLQADDDDAPEFSGKLELDPDDVNEIDGDFDQFDEDGAVEQECTFKLERFSKAD